MGCTCVRLLNLCLAFPHWHRNSNPKFEDAEARAAAADPRPLPPAVRVQRALGRAVQYHVRYHVQALSQAALEAEAQAGGQPAGARGL